MSYDVFFTAIVGGLIAIFTGVFVAFYAEKLRVLNGLRSKVLLIREDIELALDLEGRDPRGERSIEYVWKHALLDLRATVFSALPYLVSGKRQRLNTVWRELRDFDMREFYDKGTDEIVDRAILRQVTTTKKQAILSALSKLEQRIG